jgi:hypothetical protein
MAQSRRGAHPGAAVLQPGSVWRRHPRSQTIITFLEPPRHVSNRPPPQVPFFFKHAVDALAMDPTGVTPSALWGVLHLGPVALLMGYGISRAGAAFCGEMRNIVFAKV